jgi:predicted transcriptional regulator
MYYNVIHPEVFMTKDVTVSLRMDRKLSDRIDKHAKKSRRSKSSFVTLALESYLAIEAEELALTKAALARSRAGASTIPHEDVVRWMKSWGTKNELPPPSPKAR